MREMNGNIFQIFAKIILIFKIYFLIYKESMLVIDQLNYERVHGKIEILK